MCGFIIGSNLVNTCHFAASFPPIRFQWVYACEHRSRHRVRCCYASRSLSTMNVLVILGILWVLLALDRSVRLALQRLAEVSDENRILKASRIFLKPHVGEVQGVLSSRPIYRPTGLTIDLLAQQLLNGKPSISSCIFSIAIHDATF